MKWYSEWWGIVVEAENEADAQRLKIMWMALPNVATTSYEDGELSLVEAGALKDHETDVQDPLKGRDHGVALMFNR